MYIYCTIVSTEKQYGAQDRVEVTEVSTRN